MNYVNKVHSCDRTDLSRLHESYFFSLPAIMCFGAAILFIKLIPAPMQILYLGIGLSLTSYAINRNMQFKFAQHSYKKWNARPDCIEFGPCCFFNLWSILTIVILVLTIVTAAWLTYFGGTSYSSRTQLRITMMAGILLILSLVSLLSFPFGRWTKPEIVINSIGVHLWPAGRYRTMIPWAAQPRVLGCVRHNGTPVALIETRTNSFYYFPMFTLPLGYVQFQRVLEFYSGYANARRSIGTPQGLVHVRSLMDFPVSEIAKELHSQ